MYPKRLVNGDVRHLNDRKFMADDLSYRVGLSRIIQARVKGMAQSHLSAALMVVDYFVQYNLLEPTTSTC